jgi:hypothetical protein
MPGVLILALSTVPRHLFSLAVSSVAKSSTLSFRLVGVEAEA